MNYRTKNEMSHLSPRRTTLTDSPTIGTMRARYLRLCFDVVVYDRDRDTGAAMEFRVPDDGWLPTTAAAVAGRRAQVVSLSTY